MYLAFLVTLILAILIILIFIIAVKINVILNTEKSDMHITLLWIGSLIKAFINRENYKYMLSLYIFNKRVFKKSLSPVASNNKGMDLIGLISPKDIRVNLQYGFSDPFVTGITCGAVNIASQFINIDSFIHTPNFIPRSDYVHLDASAKVNLGLAFINFLKLMNKK